VSDDERRVAVDSIGFLMPLSEAIPEQIHSVRIPDVDEMTETLSSAATRAPRHIRAAVADGADGNEAEAWWGAHAGAPFLPTPTSVQDSIRQSLNLASEEQAACPIRLPSPERIRQLSAMLGMLDAVGH
jgi:hypothetical protein